MPLSWYRVIIGSIGNSPKVRETGGDRQLGLVCSPAGGNCRAEWLHQAIPILCDTLCCKSGDVFPLIGQEVHYVLGLVVLFESTSPGHLLEGSSVQSPNMTSPWNVGAVLRQGGSAKS